MSDLTKDKASEGAGFNVAGRQAATGQNKVFGRKADDSANDFAKLAAEQLADLPIHPIANIFPVMGEAEFAALKDDIAEHGQHEPIWLFDGQVIDGRHRLRACLALGIDALVRTYTGIDPVGFIVSLNLHRRHLSESQRGMVAARLATLPVGANQHAQICAPSQTEAAELLNVSRRTVQSAAKVNNSAAPELAQAVEQGEVSVSAAAALASLPPERQIDIVAAGPAEVKKAASEIRAASKPKDAPAGDMETLAAENARLRDELSHLQERMDELASNLAETLADNEGMARVFESDERVTAALAEAKRFREMNRILEERVRGLQNEKNEAIRMVKSLQRKVAKND